MAAQTNLGNHFISQAMELIYTVKFFYQYFLWIPILLLNTVKQNNVRRNVHFFLKLWIDCWSFYYVLPIEQKNIKTVNHNFIKDRLYFVLGNSLMIVTLTCSDSLPGLGSGTNTIESLMSRAMSIILTLQIRAKQNYLIIFFHWK